MNRHVYYLTGIVLILMIPLATFAIEEKTENPDPNKWELSSEINLTQTQNAYSDNWDGSETGSISWAFNLNTVAKKQISRILNTRNTLKLAYGQTHNQEADGRNWLEPTKSTDLIDLESVLRFTMESYVDPFVAGRIQTQFIDNRNQADLGLNPMTFTESSGIAKTILKDDKREWMVRLGIGLRQRLDRNYILDNATGERGKKNTSDGGIDFTSELALPLAKDRIKVTSKLTLFQAIIYSESKALEGTERANYWKATDVNLETIFTANITSFVMVNLYTQLLYDKEIDKGGRFKETLSLGLTYTLL